MARIKDLTGGVDAHFVVEPEARWSR